MKKGINQHISRHSHRKSVFNIPMKSRQWMIYVASTYRVTFWVLCSSTAGLGSSELQSNKLRAEYLLPCQRFHLLYSPRDNIFISGTQKGDRIAHWPLEKVLLPRSSLQISVQLHSDSNIKLIALQITGKRSFFFLLKWILTV